MRGPGRRGLCLAVNIGPAEEIDHFLRRIQFIKVYKVQDHKHDDGPPHGPECPYGEYSRFDQRHIVICDQNQ